MPATYRTIRKLLAVYFVWLLLEGAVRKWVLPGFSSQIFVVKDLLLWGTFVWSLSELQRENRTRLPLRIVIFATFLFTALLLLTPISVSSLIGFRYYLAGLPLLVLVPYLIEDTDDLERVGRWALMVTLPLLALAVAQYGSPPDSAINRYVGGINVPDVAVFGIDAAGSRARVTSTFSYISPYGAYLQTMSVVAWVVMLVSTRRQLVGAGMVGLVLGSMALTGARGAAAYGLVVSGVLLLFGIWQGALTRIAGGLLFAGALLLALGPFFLGEATDLLLARAGQGHDFGIRVVAFAVAPFTTLSDAEILGTGMGTTSVAASEVLGTGAGDEATFSEFDHDRVGIELGIVAYSILFAFKISLLVLTVALFFRARTFTSRTWILGSFMVQILSGLVIPFHNTIANTSYMGAVGLYFWLRDWTLVRNR